MLFAIAWRNIWRNKKRSAIIIIAIAFGLWAGLLTAGIMFGMTKQMVDTAIETRTSHIQIHQVGFRSHKEIEKYIPEVEVIIRKTRAIPDVKYAAERAVVTGMASSAVTGTGVQIYGIDPDVEKNMTQIHEKIVAGSYFETETFYGIWFN